MVDFVYDILQPIGMPAVRGYFNAKESVFLNTSGKNNSVGNIGDFFLTPARYLLGGSYQVSQINLNEQTCVMDYEFNSDTYFPLKVLKTTLCVLSLIPSLIIGSTFKGLSYISSETRLKHKIITQHFEFDEKDTQTLSENKKRFNNLGIKTETSGTLSPLREKAHKEKTVSQSLQKALKREKKIIKELKPLVQILNENNIIYWADWGTLLGVYRHGGFIPRDLDVDFSILKDDHDAVLSLLRAKLPKDQYNVWDFSPDSNRKSLIKVELRESGMLIDFYHYTINEENNTIRYEFSHIHEPIIPEEARKREVPHTKVKIPFSDVFPLKEASFDGLKVLAPKNTKSYLEKMYGKNLNPCKKFDEKVGDYVKDPKHPYWKQSEYHY